MGSVFVLNTISEVGTRLKKLRTGIMSTKDDTSSLEQPTNGQSLVVPRTAPVVARDGEWTTVAAVPRGVGPHHVDPSVYLHAVRRHWLLGTLLGVIFGAVAGVCAWFLLPQNYTAVSLAPGEHAGRRDPFPVEDTGTAFSRSSRTTRIRRRSCSGAPSF